MLADMSLHRYVPFAPSIVVGGYTLDSYLIFFNPVEAYLRVLYDTLAISLYSVVLTILLGFSIAHFLARTKHVRMRKLVMSITIASFFTGTLVRVYSWVIMLGQGGVVNTVLYALGFERLRLIGTDTAIILGLIHSSLSLAILVLVGSIRNVDPSVEQAAWTLGADPITTFIRITLPLSMPGILAAFVILYAWDATAFLVPMILGAGTHLFIANLIYDKFMSTTNFPMGSAISVVFILISLLFFSLSSALAKKLGRTTHD